MITHLKHEPFASIGTFACASLTMLREVQGSVTAFSCCSWNSVDTERFYMLTVPSPLATGRCSQVVRGCDGGSVPQDRSRRPADQLDPFASRLLVAVGV